MKIGSVGILQIDDERIAVRPLELHQDCDCSPVLKCEVIPGVFDHSNYIVMGRRNGRTEMNNRFARFLQGVDYATPRIVDVIFNDPATVVLWNDGSKTVVKCQPGDVYSKETGLALCIAKKFLGNKGNFNEVFKTWIPEETESVEKVEETPIHEGFRVGDKVYVVDSGYQYSTYSDWIRKNVKNPEDAIRWGRGRTIKNGAVGVVRHIAPHENQSVWIAYVEIGSFCYMISTPGLKKL